MSTSLVYWNEKLAKTQPRKVTFCFEITGAAAASVIVPGTPVLHTFGALASQDVIDDFLGTTSEFLLAAFDATAMGADAFGVIADMGGQVDRLVAARAACYSGTGFITEVHAGVKGGTLTASTLETAAAKGANGNLAMKVNFGNSPDFDGLTSGLIVVEFLYISK